MNLLMGLMFSCVCVQNHIAYIEEFQHKTQLDEYSNLGGLTVSRKCSEIMSIVLLTTGKLH